MFCFVPQDKGAPFTQVERFRDIPFNARLASEDVDAIDLVQQPGADGFSMDCEPLFKVSSSSSLQLPYRPSSKYS